MPKTYEPIATTTLGSATSNFEFTLIPSSYTDLILVIAGAANPAQNINMRVGNGTVDTGSNYSGTYLAYNNPPTTGRFTTQTSALIGAIYGGRGVVIIQLQNYSNTTTYKSFLSRINNASNTQVGSYVASWRSTAAINRIQFINSFDSGTSLTLYGIKAA
jgi:hypothetical protein